MNSGLFMYHWKTILIFKIKNSWLNFPNHNHRKHALSKRKYIIAINGKLTEFLMYVHYTYWFMHLWQVLIIFTSETFTLPPAEVWKWRKTSLYSLSPCLKVTSIIVWSLFVGFHLLGNPTDDEPACSQDENNILSFLEILKSYQKQKLREIQEFKNSLSHQ